MRRIGLVVSAFMAGAPALSANCLPPMQMLFACTLKNTDNLGFSALGDEVARYFCEDGSITANQGEFRPQARFSRVFQRVAP